MQYEPIKRILGKLFSGPPFMRRLYYFILDLILLRTWHVARALRSVSRLIPENARVLDAGSGPGQYSWRMAGMNKEWIITAVDIDNEQVKDCNDFFYMKGLSQRVDFIASDLVNYIVPDTFNLILSVDVMEHISDDEKVFSNFFESLRNDGYLIVSTPSDSGGSDVHSENDLSFISEHVRNGYSVKEITEKLSKAGFSDIRTKYTYGKPGYISWRLTMKYPIKFLNISYLFFIILPLYYIILLPVILILNIFDLYLNHRSGTGLLITARKLQ